MKRAIVFAALALEPAVSPAQLPDTEVWLFGVKTAKTGSVSLADPLNVSNRTGYDNQPCFSHDGRTLYYSSAREDGQTDIYSYAIKRKRNVRITFSGESEYSPGPVPGSSLICAVTVEKDSDQVLSYVDSETGRHVRTFDFDSVGYYCFLNADTVVYFKVGKPHTLRMRSLSTGHDIWLADEPARTVRALNRHSFVYGVKQEGRVLLFRYDLIGRKGTPYAFAPEGTEDFFIHPSAGLLRAGGSSLFRYDHTKEDWVLWLDLAAFGIKNISRFVLDASCTKLAIVDNP